MVLALACGCGTSARPSGTGNGAAKSKATITPAPTPEPPQKAFIDGAKDLLCIDAVDFLTGKENGSTLLGQPSDFLRDLNESSMETHFIAALSDVIENGKAQKDNANIGLNIMHDAGTGDSSVEISAGSGSDINLNSGIYIKGDTVQLKSASTKKKAILYQMADNAGTTFLDRASNLLTGLLSDDGKATTPEDNLKDRKDLASRYLDPWMTDTKPNEYTDSQQTRKLCGRDVQCRVITLNMAGQRAYSFLLGKTQEIQADAQFKSMDSSMGSLLYVLTTDVSDISKQADSKKGLTIDSATKQLIDELNALTPDEITAAKFIVSVIFNGDKAIGIEIEASTTGKTFKINAMLYRNGPEDQLSLFLQSVDGATASVDMTKVKTGDNTFDVSGQMKVTSPKGIDTAIGQFKGGISETQNKYDLNGTYTFSINVLDTHNKKQGVTISGDIAYSQTFTKGMGYAGSGDITLTVKADKDAVQMKIGLSLDSKLEDSIAVTPPMYIPSKAVTVTNEQGLYKALGGNWKDIAKEGKLIQVLSIITSLISD
jgi:hypothetical protein